MTVSKILFVCSLAALLIFGCIQPQPPSGNITPPQPPPISSLQPAREQCAVAENFFHYGPLEQELVKPSISEDVRCTGSLRKDGTLTLNIVDSKNPQRAVHVFMSADNGDSMAMCSLTNEELEEVKMIQDIFSQVKYCFDRNLYHAYCKVEPNTTPNTVVLKCGNESVVGKDSKGYYNMYAVRFEVGERVDVVDPQTGETNQTAKQRVQDDKSCQYLDPLFHSYDCGVNGAFLAIPQ